MDQTSVMQYRNTGNLRIPFLYGTCSESPNSSSGTSHSIETVSLHERVPEDPYDTETRSSRVRTVLRGRKDIMAVSSAPPHSENIVVELRDQSLWNSFRKEETEMIITKAGRRMFPFLDFSLSGLEPDQYYSCAVEIVSADNKRYRYHKSKGWTGAGLASPTDSKYCLFVHSNSASLGRYWMEQGANFERMKVSNHYVNGSGHIVLASMQKYKARIRLTKLGAHACEHWMFDFPGTEFITVTSYQNPRMTKLKIDNNPFAKAFRNGKRTTRKQDTAGQCKRRCTRFSSPPPITRYQSPFISFLSGQEAPAPASISVPALPSPPPAPALPPPPLSHERPYEEPFSTRYVPVWNDATLPWEPFEDLTSARRNSLPSMSASFKVEVCGTYTQKPDTSCALSHFEDEFRAPFFGSLFDEVSTGPNYSSQYDHFWREV